MGKKANKKQQPPVDIFDEKSHKMGNGKRKKESKSKPYGKENKVAKSSASSKINGQNLAQKQAPIKTDENQTQMKKDNKRKAAEIFVEKSAPKKPKQSNGIAKNQDLLQSNSDTDEAGSGEDDEQRLESADGDGWDALSLDSDAVGNLVCLSFLYRKIDNTLYRMMNLHRWTVKIMPI